MGILDLLLKPRSRPAKKGRLFLTSQGGTRFDSSEGSSQGPNTVRKDLLRLVLREMHTRTGIPAHWLDAQMMRSSSPRRGEGLHVRFYVRHWDPRLLEHAPAFEREYTRRLVMMDPQAREWLHGFSWQFVLPDADAAPPLPHPKSWTAPALLERVPPVQQPRSGDADAGPLLVPRTAGTARERLARDSGRRNADADSPASRPAELETTE